MINAEQEKNFKETIKKYTGMNDNQVDYHFYILKSNNITNLVDLKVINEVDGSNYSGKFSITMKSWNGGKPKYEIEFLQKRNELILEGDIKNFLTEPGNAIFLKLFEDKINFSCLIGNKYHTFDFELNRFFTCNQSEINIPSKISNYVLADFETKALSEGFPIVLKDMFNANKGAMYDSIIQIDAIKKGLKFSKFNIEDGLSSSKKVMYSRFFQYGSIDYYADLLLRRYPFLEPKIEIPPDISPLLKSTPRLNFSKENYGIEGKGIKDLIKYSDEEIKQQKIKAFHIPEAGHSEDYIRKLLGKEIQKPNSDKKSIPHKGLRL